MKRLSLLKKIALGSGAVAAVAPVTLMSTSCGVNGTYAEYIEFNTIRNELEYTAKPGQVAFKKLLFGSKKVMSGNYILFYGSNTYDNVCQFYSGSEKIRGRDQWFTNYSEETPEGRFNYSPFFYGIQKTVGESYNNFGIYNVIDFFDFKFYDNKGHEIYLSDKEDQKITLVSPWAKWTDTLITQTKKYNNSDNVPEKYDWDEKSVTTKDYIRNDDSAVKFRKFCEIGLQVYPTNDKRKKSFDVADNNKTARMMVFKNGELQKLNGEEVIDDMPTTKDAWYEIIKKFFKTEEKK